MEVYSLTRRNQIKHTRYAIFLSKALLLHTLLSETLLSETLLLETLLFDTVLLNNWLVF